MPIQTIMWTAADGEIFDTFDEAAEYEKETTITFDTIRVANPEDFKDISSEEGRVYVYPEGGSISIEGPIALQVRDSGAHIVINSAGIVTYIPAGWRIIDWIVKPGELHVSF